ncbi:hypothetical protein c7_L446 [Megavirus courdo7]|uniref:Uncharacterized protein n=1 Tax=Megavirus courdo7 TaxID=1128135 RepID=H2EAT6_9VIRU|nr:hypothetical protein c7_L446 [Megavirus courdo7]
MEIIKIIIGTKIIDKNIEYF